MSKILIIGQAPPAVKQSIPYDTTLLYTMLEWVGINKNDAQDIFEFEAVCNVFPGYGEGGHLIPAMAQMIKHWNDTLKTKVEKADKIWLLGKVSENFIASMWVTSPNAIVIKTPHPSRRNYKLIMDKKEEIIKLLNRMLAGKPL